MNPAQKRAWVEMMISLTGLICSGISYYYFNQLGDPPYATPWSYCMPLINLPIVMCMTCYVFTAGKFKASNFDEREIILSRTSLFYGFLGVFIFLTAAALIFFVRNITAAIPIRILLLLIVSSFFFSNAVISISFLLKYESRMERSMS